MNNAPRLLLLAGLMTATQAAEVAMPHLTLRHDRSGPLHEVARLAVPFAAGQVRDLPLQAVTAAGAVLPTQTRVITRHPDGSARRVMLSFPVELAPGQTLELQCALAAAPATPAPLAQVQGRQATLVTAAFRLRLDDDSVRIQSAADGTDQAVLRAFGPALTASQAPTLEVIENGPLVAWLRWRQDGADFSREVDVQVDSLGRIRLVQRLLRHLKGNAVAPDFGFELTAPGATPERLPAAPVRFLALPLAEPLVRHPELLVALRLANGARVALTNPLALLQHRGSIAAQSTATALGVRFSRLEPVAKESDDLLLQEGAWQTLDLILQPGSPDELASAVDCPLVATADWQAFDAVYRSGPPLKVTHPILQRLTERYVTALQGVALKGDDLGSFGGLERYNHTAYLWDDWFRTGDARLRRLALDYSENYHDFSVNWGPDLACYGGGRYPPNGRTQPWSGSYRTRQNDAVTFCTKGFHGFWLAYEETGDPRFRYAAEQQAKWAAEHVHATVSYMRCIGVVTDFVKLFEYTGERGYLDQAVRLWTEFQACQNPDLLFNEGGVPSTGNDLYVPDDRFGAAHPYVKSYIVQYATNALPDLLRHRPEDKRLRDTILACNDWMARVQTAGGGWSYPGPTTAGLYWSIEYSHGLMVGYAIEPKPAYLDAVGRELRTITAFFEVYDAMPARVTPWESLQGLSADDLGKRYTLSTDRDRSRDFRDGRIEFGVSADSSVYFQVLLRDYLSQRPEDSLFAADETLTAMLRMATAPDGPYAQTGDPSLRLTVVPRPGPEGLRVTCTARCVYRLAGKAPVLQWRLPDGSVCTGPEAAFVLPRAGRYELTLLAKDGAAEFTRGVTIVAPAGPGDLGAARWPTGLRLQAERFSAQGGGDVPVQARTAAEKRGSDGGSLSHWNALNAWVEWTLEVPTAGRYALLLKYASPETAERRVFLDGVEIGSAKLPVTGGYSGPDRDDWAVELLRDPQGHPARFELAVGRHLLRLVNPDAHGCNLDYVEFLPVP
jgi:hypothetical protein